MIPYSKFKPIKYEYIEKDAPTGESIRYVTEDDRVWKPVFTVTTYVTGDRYGVLKN